MYLTWGSYAHDTGECSIQIMKTSEFNEANEWWATRERWNIAGFKTNPTGVLATMQSTMLTLITAYSSDKKDLILRLPDTTPTNHALYTANCIGGTKVVSAPSFPSNRGAEGVTYENYTIAIEGLIPVGSEILYSYEETLTFSGGGRRHGHLETLIGYPQKQRLRLHTIFRVIQQGQAVGLSAYPSPPDPIWPGALVEDNPEVSMKSPRAYGGSNWRMYPITWKYTFESATPLTGEPGYMQT